MSRKDFELIARIISELPSPNETTRRITAIRFADALRGTNAGFKRDRFLAACGVGEA